MNIRTIDNITIDDIKVSPVWRYTNKSDDDETVIEPAKRLPCSNLTGRLVGTQVTLADGSHAWALLGNIDASDPRLTEHFLTVSITLTGQWFRLARYHDYDYEECGPDALAGFLGKSVSEVFPIKYDICHVFKGESAALKGFIRREPTERLTRAEIIAMAVP